MRVKQKGQAAILALARKIAYSGKNVKITTALLKRWDEVEIEEKYERLKKLHEH